MSGVDVLAVIDRAKRVLQLCDPLARSRMLPEMNSVEAQAFNARAEMEEARAAVAELIEALGKIAKADPSEDGCYYTNRSNIGIAKKALSRVRGAE